MVPAAAIIGVLALATMNGCTPSDHGTEGRSDTLSQNAAEAEAAEAKLANAEQPEKAPSKDQKTAANETNVKPGANSVSKEKSATDKTPRHPANAAGGVYVVQVGAFKNKENAEKLQEKLKAAGYPVEMHTVDHSKNGVLHLVRFLPTANRADAETTIEQLQASQNLHAQIVSVPQ
jgi:cell division septation protein DedD